MKIIEKTFFIVILISLVSCGYKPIFLKKNRIDAPIQSFQVSGDKRIGKKIVSAFNLKKQNQIEGYKLIINSNKTIETISKDSTGKTLSFKTKINVLISLISEDKVYKEKNFTADFVYNNIKSKFDLSQYQHDIEANLTDIIIEEISIFLIID
jgi:hypothetical protein